MILDINQITDIILNNPNQALISKGVENNKTLRMHLYGEHLRDQMEKIEDYESANLNKLRAKYAKSNKDLFSRLSRPMDKIFSAKGGSVYFNLPESKESIARALSLNVVNGIGVRKYIETRWLPHLKDDPAGIIFFELLPQVEAIKAKKQGRSVCYPTYKSITSIFDYLPKGSHFEYIVFNVGDAEKQAVGIDPKKTIYRVVDDAMDYFVEREAQTVSILTQHSYPNYFGEQVAISNSDLVSPQDDTSYESVFQDVVELARNFLLKSSIRLTHDFLHGFPKYWQYATACTACKGTKYVSGEECKTCFGTGKEIMLRVSDAMLLETPTSKDDVVIAPNVAGYVAPEKIFYEISTNDLQLLEEIMNVTIWGSGSQIQVQGMKATQNSDVKTATEIVADMKPQADRLNVISEMAEKRHKFILDNVVKINLNLPNYQDSSVNYGRRYLIEDPDSIWDKYENARTKGAPVSVLEDLLIEYYEAKYQGDAISLAIAEKLMYVEPFVHLTGMQVDASPSITNEDKAAKAYFTEWLSTLNEVMILTLPQDILKQQLSDYAKAKATEIQDAKTQELQQQQQFKQPIAA